MTRTTEQMRDALLSHLDEKYSLVYVDYRDELSSDQIDLLARGDWEAFWESNMDWESSARWEGAKYEYDELVKQYLDDDEEAIEFASSNYREEVIEAIMDRDYSDPCRELARHSSDVLMRVSITNEDTAWAMGQESPEADAALATVGLPITPKNIEVMNSILAETNPYYSGAIASLIFAAPVDWLYDLPTDEDAVIEVTDPYIWIGNPWQGDGWVNEEPFEGTLRFKRGDLRTDKDAWGYGWQATSDCYVSGYEVTLKVIEPANAS